MTRKVVPMAKACSYVALSYVWGNCLDDAPGLSVFPRTIEDALTVTQALGFEYLCKSRVLLPMSMRADETLNDVCMGRIDS
jgi:hypothetical protein